MSNYAQMFFGGFFLGGGMHVLQEYGTFAMNHFIIRVQYHKRYALYGGMNGYFTSSCMIVYVTCLISSELYLLHVLSDFLLLVSCIFVLALWCALA